MIEEDVSLLYNQAYSFYKKGDITNSIAYLERCFKRNINYLLQFFFDKRFDSLKEHKSFQKLLTPTKEYTINEFISLKLIFSKTIIYVDSEIFLTCQKIALNLLPHDFQKYRIFYNIDDIIEFYKKNNSNTSVEISPQEEFWDHCSNLQAWVENDYNTSIISKNLGFPILLELSKRDIARFNLKLKKELIERIKTGGLKAILYFLADTETNYLNYLTEDDFFDHLLQIEEGEILKNISQFTSLDYTLTTNLRDSRKFNYLRHDNKLHFCIENGFIIELEILIVKKSYSEEYRSALLQVVNLKKLKEIDIYFSEKFKEKYKVFSKTINKNDINFFFKSIQII